MEFGLKKEPIPVAIRNHFERQDRADVRYDVSRDRVANADMRVKTAVINGDYNEYRRARSALKRAEWEEYVASFGIVFDYDRVTRGVWLNFRAGDFHLRIPLPRSVLMKNSNSIRDYAATAS